MAGLDGLLGDCQIKVAGTIGFEQGLPKLRANIPIRLQGIHVGAGNAALQMSLDVLNIFGLLAVDIARDVQVEFVLLDFLDADHARVFGNLQPLVEDIDDLVDVHIAQAVLVAVLHVAAAGVDHEDALAGVGVFLVDDDDAGGNAGAVKQVGGQADDAFDVALADQVPADVGLGIAPKQNTVRQNAGAFAGAFQRAHDVQQIGVIALLGRRRAEMLEALVRVVERVDAGAPAFVAERRIGDDIVEGFELAVIAGKKRISQRVALLDQGRRVVVQDHIHARQAGGGGVFFLPVERDLGAGFVAHFQQQRTGTAGRVINGGVVRRVRIANADDLRHDAADLGGRVELALALAALGGEVTHQVFVGIAKNVITFRAVLAEIERLVFKDGDQVGETLDNLRAAAQLAGIIKVRHVRQLVGIGQRRDDLLVDLVANVGLTLERDHVLEAGAFGNRNRRVRNAGVFVADVFDEQQHEDIVLVLAGIHAAAKFVATGPERGIKLGFFNGHYEVVFVLICPPITGGRLGEKSL